MSSSKGIFHFLVADDDPVATQVLQAALRSMGHWADVCHDGEKALELAVMNHYSLLILDFNMPVKSGAEVVRNLRSIGNGVPVIILSAHPPEEIRPEVEDLELVKILTKPAHRRELAQAIKEMAGSVRS